MPEIPLASQWCHQWLCHNCLDNLLASQTISSPVGRYSALTCKYWACLQSAVARHRIMQRLHMVEPLAITCIYKLYQCEYWLLHNSSASNATPSCKIERPVTHHLWHKEDAGKPCPAQQSPFQVMPATGSPHCVRAC